MPKNKIEINHGRREVSVGGRNINLKKSEYEILRELVESGELRTREQLGKLIGQSPERIEIGTRSVDQTIYSLRRKIGRDSIVTAPGYGYKIGSKHI